MGRKNPKMAFIVPGPMRAPKPRTSPRTPVNRPQIPKTNNPFRRPSFDPIKKFINTGNDTGLKKVFEPAPQHVTRKNTRVEPVTVADNGQENDEFEIDTRFVVTGVPVAGDILGQILTGDKNPKKKPQDKAPDGGSLFRQQRLPQGSNLISTITLGRDKFPQGSIAQRAKATIFESDFAVPNTNDIKTGAAYRAQQVGFNETHYSLIPIELTNKEYRRINSMAQFSYESSIVPVDNQLKQNFDSPTSATFDQGAPGTDITGQRSTYCPLKTTSEFTVSNLNAKLPMGFKATLVQLRAPQNVSSAVSSDLWINPYNTLSTLLGSLPVSDALQANPTFQNQFEDNVQHLCWGVPYTEAASKIGRYDMTLKTSKRLESSPLFDRLIRKVGSTKSYSIGPGSTRTIKVERNRHMNYTAMGDLDRISDSTNYNVSTVDRMFLLVQYTGARDQVFYRAKRKADNSVDRLYGVSLSAPTQFTTSLKMGIEVPLERNLYKTVDQGGCTYKRSYVNVSNINRIDKIVSAPYSSVIQDEQDLAAAVGTIGYIFPVNTPTTLGSAGPMKVKDDKL